MQRSFSIVMDDSAENYDDEQVLKKYGSLLSSKRNSHNAEDFDKSMAKLISHESSEMEDEADETVLSPIGGKPTLKMPPSAGPSGRQTVLRSRSSKNHLSSDSDLDISEGDDEKKNAIPGEYDPKLYEQLEVSPEIKDVFQYITKYIPQTMSLDHRFKPFVPEFLPAVGDIDAFLKVVPPARTASGDGLLADQHLGLVVLDEPAANQSDSALLHLQLRAESVNTTHDSDVVVKKLDNVERNAKVIDKWIKDISALHKSKSFPVVRYSEPMPELDELMQEWPDEMEKRFRDNDFPEPEGSLDDYIEEVCAWLQIPTGNKIEALHLLFSLYAAVKSSQLFKNTQLEKSDTISDDLNENAPDQLVLE